MSKLPEPLRGVVPPVCTPLTEDGKVDHASLERLIDELVRAGVHALFLLGSTSESMFLTDRERAEVVKTGVAAAAGRVPVLAGVIDAATGPSLVHAEAAVRAGADGLVLTAPFYGRVSQQEIVHHFRMVRAAAGVPIFAYDVPPAVHVKIERPTLVAMAREGLIAGVKDSSGDDANLRAVLLETRDLKSFATFTGSELLVDTAVMMGASGTVPGLGNVDPAGYVRLYDAAVRGDWTAARREQERLFRLFSIVYAADLGRMGWTAAALGGFKTALVLRGWIATNVTTRPLTRLNAEETERVRSVMVEVGLL
jgi:4-hydroxy-tetrahydrodipicolinate synthase